MRRAAGKHLRDHAAHGNAGNVRALHAERVENEFDVARHILEPVLGVHRAARDVFGDARKHARLAHFFGADHAHAAVAVVGHDQVQTLAHEPGEEGLGPGRGVHAESGHKHKRRHRRIAVQIAAETTPAGKKHLLHGSQYIGK